MSNKKNLSELHSIFKIAQPEHPILSIYSFENPPTKFPCNLTAFTGDFFMIALKKIKSSLLLYSRTKYDHATEQCCLLNRDK